MIVSVGETENPNELFVEAQDLDHYPRGLGFTISRKNAEYWILHQGKVFEGDFSKPCDLEKEIKDILDGLDRIA